MRPSLFITRFPDGKVGGKVYDASAVKRMTEKMKKRSQEISEARQKALDRAKLTEVVFHGTNQAFDSFSNSRLGQSTQTRSSTMAFFFTDSPECAGYYAQYASKQTISEINSFESTAKKLKEEADRQEKIATKTGKWSAYEKAYQAWEDFEIAGLREPENTGACIYPVRLKMSNPLELDFDENDSLSPWSMDDIISDAKKNGHDGVIIKNISDNPGEKMVKCTHLAVFSADQIVSVFDQKTEIRHDVKRRAKQSLSI